MNNTDNATPRPWIKVNDILIRGQHGESICGTKINGESFDPNYKANAALIVRAVNNFDALIEACKKAYTMIGEDLIDENLSNYEGQEKHYKALHIKLGDAINAATK